MSTNQQRTAHTPGPWHVRGEFDCDIYDDEGAWIVNQVCSGAGDASNTGLENARLIVAAPEMLAALERVREDINWMLNSGKILTPSAFEHLDTAIAKAKGESP